MLLGLGAIGAVVSLAGDAERDDDGDITDAGNVSAFDLQEGDCIDVPDAGEVADVRGMPCADPHDGEVYALFDLDGANYPGQKAADRTALRGCADRFQDFIGKSYRSSELIIYYLQPTEASWETQDDREVVCAVTEPNGKKTTVETLEGANR